MLLWAPMIRVAGLRKSYGDRLAVADLSFAAEPGQITALLGQNGAGKSTTIGCLTGLVDPDAGTLEVAGIDVRAQPRAAKRLLGYVPETAMLYEPLTPHEYLLLKGRLFGLDDAAITARSRELLDGFDLGARGDEPMSAFSKGMLQKVAIAAALLPGPRVLVLDEPLTGLDAGSTLLLKEIMREFARRGGTLLYSSHLLDVVETLADRVVVIHAGKKLAEGTLQQIRGASRLEDAFRVMTQSGDPAQLARSMLGSQGLNPAH